MSGTAPSGSWRWLKPALTALAAAAAVFAVWLAWDRELLAGWRQSAEPLPFFAAMAVLPALGVPITPLFILAGATFGYQVGLLGSGVALGLNLALCFGIARTLRPKLATLLHRVGYALPDFATNQRSPLRFTLAIKLAPGIPAFVKHYVLALSGVPFPVYFGVSMVVTGLLGTVMVVLGESLLQHRLSPGVVAGGLLLAAAGLSGWYWRRSRRGPPGSRRTLGRDPAGGPPSVRGGGPGEGRLA